MNKVFLSGTVESGPKLRLETGKPDQATFQLSAWHRAENGQWRREAYTVCCQNKRAYWAMVNIEAGQRIAVEGTLLGAGQVKIAALEIEYTSGRKRENGYTEDTQCGTTQGTTDDDADEGCEKEEPMETAEQAKELGEAQTEAQTPTPGKAQSNDGIDPRQLKWYDVGKKYGRTEASRARSAQGWNAAPGGKDGDKDGRFSRMGKKLLSMVLALVLALGIAVCGGAEDAIVTVRRDLDEMYTIWGLEWDMPLEEALQKIDENGGWDREYDQLYKISLFRPWKHFFYYLDSKDKNKEIKVYVTWEDEEVDRQIWITIYDSKVENERNLQTFVDIVNALLEQGCQITAGGYVVQGNRKRERWPWIWNEGKADLIDMQESLRKGDIGRYWLTFRNIEVRVSMTNSEPKFIIDIFVYGKGVIDYGEDFRWRPEDDSIFRDM